MKRLTKTDPKFVLLFALAFAIVALLLILTSPASNTVGRTQLGETYTMCSTGVLDSIPAAGFIGNAYPLGGDSYYSSIENAFTAVRKNGDDFVPMYVTYSLIGGKEQLNIPFVSASQMRRIVWKSGELSFYLSTVAQDFKVIDPASIRNAITPLDAVKTAKPILNCHNIDPAKMDRFVRLGIEPTENKLVWMVTIQESRLPDPGYSQSYTVEIDALTGKVRDL